MSNRYGITKQTEQRAIPQRDFRPGDPGAPRGEGADPRDKLCYVRVCSENL